jgi:pyruvate carboxylase
VKKNQPLFIIEAMKMETTVTATAEGTVKRIALEDATLVESDDLVLVLS